MMDAYTHLAMAAPNPVAEFRERMARTGIDYALAVETWKGDNYEVLEALLHSQPSDFRVVLCFREESRSRLCTLVAHPMLAGIRVRTAALPRLEELAGLLVSSGKWLVPHAESGIGALTNQLLRLGRAYRDLRIYLPHCGWPRRERVDDPDWDTCIAELAALPNIIAGISAIHYFSSEPFPHRDVQPFAAKLIKSFGANSIAAASDYPMFDPQRYSEYISLARQWIIEQCPVWSPAFEPLVFDARRSGPAERGEAGRQFFS